MADCGEQMGRERERESKYGAEILLFLFLLFVWYVRNLKNFTEKILT